MLFKAKKPKLGSEPSETGRVGGQQGNRVPLPPFWQEKMLYILLQKALDYNFPPSQIFKSSYGPVSCAQRQREVGERFFEREILLRDVVYVHNSI